MRRQPGRESRSPRCRRPWSPSRRRALAPSPPASPGTEETSRPQTILERKSKRRPCRTSWAGPARPVWGGRTWPLREDTPCRPHINATRLFGWAHPSNGTSSACRGGPGGGVRRGDEGTPPAIRPNLRSGEARRISRMAHISRRVQHDQGTPKDLTVLTFLALFLCMEPA